jgi:nitrite reductase/ring-hydroxylating ferredoxin subunit
MHVAIPGCLVIMSVPAARWLSVCKVSDEIPPHGLPCQVEGHEIAVFWVNGQRYATSNICTHQFAFLTDGYVEGEHVDCPMHQGRFHIPTGAPEDGPVSEPLRTYSLRVEDDEVLIEIPGTAD